MGKTKARSARYLLQNGLEEASYAKPCSSAGGMTRRRTKLSWSGSKNLRPLPLPVSSRFFPLPRPSRHKSACASRVAFSTPTRTHDPRSRGLLPSGVTIYNRIPAISFSRHAQQPLAFLQPALGADAFQVAPRQVSTFFFRQFRRERTVPFFLVSFLLSLAARHLLPWSAVNTDREHPGPP